MNEMIQKAKNICAIVTEMEMLIYNKRHDKIYNYAPKNYILFHDSTDMWNGCRFTYDYDFKNTNTIQILDNIYTIYFNPREYSLSYVNYDTDGDDFYNEPFPVFEELIEEDIFFQNSLVQEYKFQEIMIIMAYLKRNCNIGFSLHINDVTKMMKLLEIENG